MAKKKVKKQMTVQESPSLPEAEDNEFVRLVDFAQYYPSYNAFAAFIGTPVYDGNEKIKRHRNIEGHGNHQ